MQIETVGKINSLQENLWYEQPKSFLFACGKVTHLHIPFNDVGYQTIKKYLVRVLRLSRH